MATTGFWKNKSVRIAIIGAVAAGAALIGAATLTAGARSLDDVGGLWQSRGYGFVADVSGNRFRLIQHSEAGCVLSASYSGDDVFDDYRLRKPDDETLELQEYGLLSSITFDRIDEAGFEGLCLSGVMAATDDPGVNFDLLWSVFNEHYAFFDERGIDWRSEYEKHRPEIDASTSQRDLERHAHQLLRVLGDGHVWLWTGVRSLGSPNSPLTVQLRRECRDATNCNFGDYYDAQTELFRNIIDEDYLDDNVDSGLAGSAHWGALTPEIGYLRLDAMSGFGGWSSAAEQDERRASKLIDRVFDSLGDPEKLVIDVRMNEGGYDTVALAIAGRFTEETVVFGSKYAKFKDGRTEPTPMVVTPTGSRQYAGDVVLLVGPETISAAEVFALAMRELPNVTLIGERTQGILSDNFYRQLPNGWSASLSNETYLSASGEQFEVVGVPADQAAPVFALEDRRNRRDPALDAAIRLLSSK